MTLAQRDELPVDEAPTRRPSLAAAALAVVLPLGILGGVLSVEGRPPDPAAKSPEAEAMEARLAKTGDDVVVLGNSKVGTDIDDAALAKALGRAVAPLGVDATRAATWYAVLENRVYAAGHTPDLVVVYAPLAWTLALTTGGEFDRQQLANHVGAEEPALDRKLYGRDGGSGPVARARERLSGKREAWMHGLRDWSVGLVFGGGPEGGKALAEPALGKLFGTDAGAALTERHRAIPIVEQDATGANDAASVDGSLVPDFLALAKDHGSRIVFVRAPLGSTRASQDALASDVERDVLVRLNEAGAGYVDLRGVVADSAYGDGIHMTAFGKGQLTAALAAGLAKVHALGDGPMVATPVHARPTVTRTGTPPAMPEIELVRGPFACGWMATVPTLNDISDHGLERAFLGALSPVLVLEDGIALKPHATREEFDMACKGAFSHQIGAIKLSPTGDRPEAAAERAYTLALADEIPIRSPTSGEGWWVYPGTTLRLAYPEGWTSEAPGFGVELEARARGAGPGVPTMRVDDAPPMPLTGAEGRLRAAWSGPAPTKAWAVEVTSPADGPYVLVRRLAVGSPEDTAWAIGGADTGRSMALLRQPLAYAAPPRALGALGPPEPVDAASARFTADLGVPADDTTARRASLTFRCSPLRVAEDGKPLALSGQKPEDVAKGGGRYAHAKGAVLVSGADGTSPATNGRAYTASLDETRKCDFYRWLYPGDTLTVTADAVALGMFERGAARLEVGGAAIGDDPDARMSVRLWVDGALRVDDAVPLATLATSPPSWPVDPPVAPGAKELRLELSVPATAPYVLLTTAALSEPAHAPFRGPQPG